MKSEAKVEAIVDIRIVILQRGWVFVGRFSRDGSQCYLDQAHVIRRWGTTSGLGELARNGPLERTVIDPVPRVQFHELTAIAIIACDVEKWRTICQ